MQRILIIEDDPAILKGLRAGLEEEHYHILTESDGEKGYQLAQRENIDLIILDLMLPSKNGEDICKELRQKGIQTPIIMLTSKSDELNKVLGLELGADDYVTKPFSIRELKARIKAQLRRAVVEKKEIEVFSFSDVHLDFKRQEATKQNKALKLSAKEFDIMKILIQYEGEVVSRDMLLNEIWGYEIFPTTRTVDNYILNLRKKIESDPTNPRHLLTMHKSGYKFVK
jgi:DNA-binding response OmpR family regulator